MTEKKKYSTATQRTERPTNNATNATERHQPPKKFACYCMLLHAFLHAFIIDKNIILCLFVFFGVYYSTQNSIIKACKTPPPTPQKSNKKYTKVYILRKSLEN